MGWCFGFPPHLSSASALPCEIGNPEHSTLVHCACSTVQLLQYSRRLSWTMPPNSPELNTLITRFTESYSSVIMSRESKRLKKWSSWLNSGNALIQHLSENAIFMFTVSPGGAEAQVIWGGIVKHPWLLTLSVTFLPKRYQNPFTSVNSKPKVGRF